MPDNLVSLDAICQHIGVNSVTIYTWISTKKLPAHLVDGTWMFDKEQIDSWQKEAGLTAADAVPDKEG